MNEPMQNMSTINNDGGKKNFALGVIVVVIILAIVLLIGLYVRGKMVSSEYQTANYTNNYQNTNKSSSTTVLSSTDVEADLNTLNTNSLDQDSY